ncbi:MAG: carboxypeptidase-like regulatory domain-containing protein, partial [Bacteroidetes bacterium]|nr:carboxypeptidase-like regulatory domain-containing protein [Bacteroidota bacterium]
MKRTTFLLLILMLPFSWLMAQSTIKGTVRDKITNETLPGANVIIEGTTSGTITDIDGKYSFDVAPGNYNFIVRFVGYEASQRNVIIESGQTLTINWVLSPDVTELEELVVVGYGVQQKSVVTGAISGVRSKDLANMPVTRLEQALQ